MLNVKSSSLAVQAGPGKRSIPSPQPYCPFSRHYPGTPDSSPSLCFSGPSLFPPGFLAWNAMTGHTFCPFQFSGWIFPQSKFQSIFLFSVLDLEPNWDKLSYVHSPEWRNGRRARLKIWCPFGRVGSTPTSGTTIKSLL